MAISSTQGRHTASTGVAWLASQSIARQVIAFGMFVLLGRLLDPIDFGTVGLSSSIIIILQSIASYGIASAVIQKADLTDDEADVAYTLNWFIAGSIFLLILFTAVFLGTFWFHGDPFPFVLGALSLSPLLSATYEIQQARMLRAFRFDVLAKKALAAQIVGGIIALGSAFAGAGVWSLVLQQYTVLMVELVIVLLASPWRPRLRIEREFLLHLWAFGSHLMGARFLGTIDARVIDLIIGAFIGQAAVGFYRVARNLFDVVVSVFATPIQSVALPHFSSKQADLATVRSAFLEMTEAFAWLLLPPFLVLSVWAPVFVVAVFGAKWAASGWILQVLSLQIFVLASFWLYDPLLVGMGSTKRAFQLRCWQTGASFVFCLASAHFGLEALVVAQVLSLFTTAPVMFLFVSRALDLDLATFSQRVWKPYFFSCLFIAGACALDRYFVPEKGLPGLLVILVPGYICYCVAFYLFANDALRRRARNLLHTIFG